MPTLRIALSGAPGTGKTSIINELEKRGYACSPEYSRQIIRESQETGSKVTPWDDLDAFSHLVMEGRIQQHEKASGALHFFDRTIIDTIAYQELDELIVQPNWVYAAKSLRYAPIVFLTPPWKEIYQWEQERQESVAQLEKIHLQLKKSYREYGYEVMEVPKLSIEDRTSWIINQVEQLK